MRVAKILPMATGAGAVLDLRPVGNTGPFNQVGHLRVSAVPGASPGHLYFKPVVVADGATVPAAPVATPQPVNGTAADWLTIKTDSLRTEELGDAFSRGYQRDIHGEPVATHLLVWCESAAILQAVGE